MKILLQSTLFWPSVGGIETVTECLANHYVLLGHTCTVITRTTSDKPDKFNFRVVRNPTLKEKKDLLASHDILHCNGASMELVFLAKLLKKQVVWTHAGYQLLSIDGLGWYEGEPSPLSPFASFRFHCSRQGLIKAISEFAKLKLRRFAAIFVQHVAITKWVAARQPFKNQVVIYNPFPIDRFVSAKSSAEEEYDFFFLGRLVSEKGVDTLLMAFSNFLTENPAYSKKLLIIGDGNRSKDLKSLATELSIHDHVHFAGRQTGSDLLEYVKKGKIAIIPSAWEEPMGGVALEMLAAGKPVIVSLQGGLAECVEGAGLVFPNGDAKALSNRMMVLLQDEALQDQLKQHAAVQVSKFNQTRLTRQYIELFERLVK